MASQKVSVSFRTEKSKIRQLDALAKQQRRDRTQLIDEAIENYLEVQRWHLEEIDAAIREADAGGFATEEEVQAAFDRLLK